MNLCVMILAAGSGTRMCSQRPKVTHDVGGLPMIVHSVLTAKKLKPKKVVVIVPKDAQPIKEAFKENSMLKNSRGISFATQAEQKGTAHAVLCGLKQLGAGCDVLMVVNGDMPLIQATTLSTVLRRHSANQSVLSFLTATVEDHMGFGRVLRDSHGRLLGVVEESDANAEQKKINEVNSAIYCFDLDFLKSRIRTVKNHNRQQEFYLPDLIALAVQEALPLEAVAVDHAWEVMGVNSCAQLHAVNAVFYQRQRESFMERGVSFVGTEIFIDAPVQIAPDVLIKSPCYLQGKTKIASHVVVETGAVIADSVIDEGSLLKAYSYLNGAHVGKNCRVGPFAHLRPQTRLQDGVRVGNFVEVKKTVIGVGSKANHLSYLGDALIGRGVNVGAGTITCNYDGKRKARTVLEDGVFVGSDTQLVAPVRVRKGAYIGSGTTVTKDVGPDSLAISRVPQQEIPGWARRHRRKISRS